MTDQPIKLEPDSSPERGADPHHVLDDASPDDERAGNDLGQRIDPDDDDDNGGV